MAAPVSPGSGEGILCLKSSCEAVPAMPCEGALDASLRTEAGVLVTSEGSLGAKAVVRLGLGVVVVRKRSLTTGGLEVVGALAATRLGL